jgi:hypothetical protein
MPLFLFDQPVFHVNNPVEKGFMPLFVRHHNNSLTKITVQFFFDHNRSIRSLRTSDIFMKREGHVNVDNQIYEDP